MKNISLTLCLSIAAQAAPSVEKSQLFNLRNHHKLASIETTDTLRPIETLARVNTFDEIPVFGGVEFRDKLLEK